MKDDHKTKKQLIDELTELRSQNAALEKSRTGIVLDELAAEEARRYAESIVETVREPLLILDADLKIISANRNFYKTFKVIPGETIGNFIYALGNKQWDISRLRELLENVLPEKEAFDDFEVEHNFQDIGHKIMLLNARQIYRRDIGTKMVLLAIEDITERKRMEEKILTLSITDQLTGLYNRRGFLSLAEQQLKLSARNKSGLQLFFADLDLLKLINDVLGHEEGDKALIEAVNILKETFRTSDIIARLGGDEFAVLAIDIKGTNPEVFTARLQQLIDIRNNQKKRKYNLSISIGCAYYDHETPCSIDDLIARADKLMYEKKQKKKGLLLQQSDDI